MLKEIQDAPMVGCADPGSTTNLAPPDRYANGLNTNRQLNRKEPCMARMVALDPSYGSTKLYGLSS
jgi:hypothetical protein